jgi:hypothetical protein
MKASDIALFKELLNRGGADQMSQDALAYFYPDLPQKYDLRLGAPDPGETDGPADNGPYPTSPVENTILDSLRRKFIQANKKHERR